MEKMICEKCYERFELKNAREKADIRACSTRCAERVWVVCPKCLEKAIKFMDGL